MYTSRARLIFKNHSLNTLRTCKLRSSPATALISIPPPRVVLALRIFAPATVYRALAAIRLPFRRRIYCGTFPIPFSRIFQFFTYFIFPARSSLDCSRRDLYTGRCIAATCIVHVYTRFHAYRYTRGYRGRVCSSSFAPFAFLALVSCKHSRLHISVLSL